MIWIRDVGVPYFYLCESKFIFQMMIIKITSIFIGTALNKTY